MADANSYKNLLRKKSWTGQEVGKLLIASMLHDIKCQTGKEGKKPLFSPSDFAKIEDSLTSDQDCLVYGVYRDLYSSIIDSFNHGQGLYQQFENGFSSLFRVLHDVCIADEAKRRLDRAPVLMTQSQYERLEGKAIETLREKRESFSSLLFRCLTVFLDADEADIKGESFAVWEALEGTKKMPVAGNRFSELYNKREGHGYTCLPDGRRSDQMTEAEWEQAFGEEYLKLHNIVVRTTVKEAVQQYILAREQACQALFFKGAEAIREYVLRQTGEPLNGTDEEIECAFTEIYSEAAGKASGAFDTDASWAWNPLSQQIKKAVGFTTPGEWHAYKELPEGTSLYDLLDLYAEQGDIKAFREDATDLYKALKAYMESKVPQLKGLRASQFRKDVVSWGELAAAGLIGCVDLLQPSDNLIICMDKKLQHRTEAWSIAIVKRARPSDVDEQGDYKESRETTSLLSIFRTLDTLEKDTEELELLRKYATLYINPSLGYLYAFNALMEILGEVYDLPELASVARYDTHFFENKINAYNGYLYGAYTDVCGDEAEKQRKRAILKYAFIPLETEPLKPSQEAVEEVREELTKLGFSTEARRQLKYLDAFINRLMYSGKAVVR